jgi:hypothetical protein
MDGPPDWGWAWGTTPCRKNFLLLRNVSKRHGSRLILWHDLSIGKLVLHVKKFIYEPLDFNMTSGSIAFISYFNDALSTDWVL